MFFLTDGQPTEKDTRWQTALEDLRDPAFKERPNILAFGVGEAEPEVIGLLASTPGFAFMMDGGRLDRRGDRRVRHLDAQLDGVLR